MAQPVQSPLRNVALQIDVDLIYQVSLRNFTKLTDTVNITVYAGAFMMSML